MAVEAFTLADLRHCLRYEPETGLFFRTSGRCAGQQAGVVKNGYVYVPVFKKQIRAHRAAWAMTHGRWPRKDIDHKNGNKLDNRIDNLRETDSTGNNQNLRRSRSTSKSGLIGAFFESSSGLYRSTIRANGKNHDLGRYPTADEAHAAYVAAKRRLHSTCTL
jgi:HNH endonuclease